MLDSLEDRFRRGDPDALSAAQKLYRDRLRVMCEARLSYVYQDVEDALSMTFTNAWENRRSFEGRNGSTLGTWLTRIAMNCCQDMLRKNLRRQRLTDGLLMEAIDRADEQDGVAADEETEHVERHVERLVEAHGENVRHLIAVDTGESTYDDIAQKKGIKRTSVEEALSRLRTKLKKQLGVE